MTIQSVDALPGTSAANTTPDPPVDRESSGGFAAVRDWLAVLVRRQVLRHRARYELSADEFRGLYVSDEHVDRVLAGNWFCVGTDAEDLGARALHEWARAESSLRAHGPWRQMVREFLPSQVEQQLMLLALMREMDPAFPTLYAYLNDHASRRHLTRGLALRLLDRSTGIELTGLNPLAEGGMLFREGLMCAVGADAERSWMERGMVLHPLVSHRLLGGGPEFAPLPWELRIEPCSGRRVAALDSDLQRRLDAILECTNSLEPGQERPWLVLEGERGSGRLTASRYLASRSKACLLRLGVSVPDDRDALHRTVEAIRLHQRLYGSVLLVSRGFSRTDGDQPYSASLDKVVEALSPLSGLTAIRTMPNDPWRTLLEHREVVVVPFTTPNSETRRLIWRSQARLSGADPGALPLREIAERFALTPGQIARAVRSAAYAAAPSNDGDSPEARMFESAREQGRSELGALAVRVDSPYTWSDLVLPRTVLSRIQQIAQALRHRETVFEHWGFAKRTSGSRGLSVLFSGPPGTGKTMSAVVIARDLGVDLYAIDLSGIVSKYVGETEKNLDRVFRAACSSNALLLFDEADALFGKRSEVKDAHDRYANIEVAYLLQKIEAYDGPVILATNLGQNIDQAFSRRMHYVVEFALPDEASRERLWTAIFPPEAPVDRDLDLAFLAQQFPIAGGDIRNVALDAGFLAAQDARVISMEILMRAMARQWVKQGRTPTPAAFREYFPLVAGEH